MLEKKLNKMRGLTTKSELIKGLKECGFSVFSNPNTEHGWFDDGLNDTVVKVIPHSCNVIPLDWYCEGKGRKDAPCYEVIDNILESIEYNFDEFICQKYFIKKMYNILFNEEYTIDIPEFPTLEDKLNLLNEGIEVVDDNFIEKLKSIGIDDLEYDEDAKYGTLCKYYTESEKAAGKTTCFDGYVIYYYNTNTEKNSTVYECMKELDRLYNTGDCGTTVEALKYDSEI